jgi:hypothetical protein
MGPPMSGSILARGGQTAVRRTPCTDEWLGPRAIDEGQPRLLLRPQVLSPRPLTDIPISAGRAAATPCRTACSVRWTVASWSLRTSIRPEERAGEHLLTGPRQPPSAGARYVPQIADRDIGRDGGSGLRGPSGLLGSVQLPHRRIELRRVPTPDVGDCSRRSRSGPARSPASYPQWPGRPRVRTVGSSTESSGSGPGRQPAERTSFRLASPHHGRGRPGPPAKLAALLLKKLDELG